MLRRLVVFAVSVCVLVGLVQGPAAAQSEPPDSMAALGNSITRAFDSCGFFVDCPYRSFATGASPQVNSHFLRIFRQNPAIAGDRHNNAVSGATVADLPDQASEAVAQGVDYVTILVGANDACKSSVDAMTPVGDFRDRLDEALDTLDRGLPEAKVFVSSIPDVYRLWEVAKEEAAARAVWELGDICQSLLDDPLSDAPADKERRREVRQQVKAYNTQLVEACAAYGPNCDHDEGAVFEYDFRLTHISPWDYFHPSTAGQKVLARITYEAGFDW